jgi:hypothetical protein
MISRKITITLLKINENEIQIHYCLIGIQNKAAGSSLF